jgi:outer membrane biosynthesis protein TonB
MPFTGCGKLKNSPASGLNQTEPFAPSKVNNQSEKVELVKQEEVKKVEPVKPTPLPKPSAPPETKAVKTVEKEVAVEKKTTRFWTDVKDFWNEQEIALSELSAVVGIALMSVVIWSAMPASMPNPNVNTNTPDGN